MINLNKDVVVVSQEVLEKFAMMFVTAKKVKAVVEADLDSENILRTTDYYEGFLGALAKIGEGLGLDKLTEMPSELKVNAKVFENLLKGFEDACALGIVGHLAGDAVETSQKDFVEGVIEGHHFFFEVMGML